MARHASSGVPAAVILPVATSIAPAGDPALQQRALGAWMELGAEVHSLNSPAEIQQLAPLYPQVRFTPVARTGQAVCGRPLVHLADLFAHLAGLDAPVVGLVNSDILPVDLDLVRAEEAANQAAIAGVRLDVDDLDSRANPAAVQGFDYFLLPSDRLAGLACENFYLGMPYWDYWLPATLLLQGCPVLITDPPAALHRAHSQVWGERALMLNAIFTAEMLDELERGRAAGGPLLSGREGLAVDVLRHYQQSLLHRVFGAARPADAAAQAHADLSAREFGDFFAAAVRAFVEQSAGRIDLRR